MSKLHIHSKSKNVLKRFRLKNIAYREVNGQIMCVFIVQVLHKSLR